ncbi:MAG: DUF962 domain-containing protein [Sandaracinaceae bacterium]|nr:DUF962 domain-containing protein [Sandaracinaceae bacterium]MCC6875783.1 DUF962 domain-containing protein [Sandaracinaceae bacterium]
MDALFKNKNLAMLAGGTASLMTGGKLTALGLFARGLYGLEEQWREAHPEFEGGLAERWKIAIDFYEQTHQDGVNRALHTVGIPMILGGAIGLLIAPSYTPPWWAANASWSIGWTLNFVGHAFEGKSPAFAADPLSFVAGPVWDFMRLRDKLTGRRAEAEPAEAPVPAVATA